MNYYQPTQPRLVSGLASLFLSAVTIGVLVVLPSKMESESQAYAMLAKANAPATASCLRATM
jgi:hypothetical protein